MDFSAPPPEFPQQYNEPRLSKVLDSPLYERRTTRPAIDDTPYFAGPATSSSNTKSDEMELSDKMGMLDVAQPPPNPGLPMPAQRQVKELVNVIEAAEVAIRNQMEENEHLRSALRVTEWELQNSKMDQHAVTRAIEDRSRDLYQPRQNAQRAASVSAAERQGHVLSSLRTAGNREGYGVPGMQEEQQGSIIVHPTAGQGVHYQNGVPHGPQPAGPAGHQGVTSNGTNGGLKSHNRSGVPHLPPIVDTNSSGVSSPSSRSMSPTHASRRREGELEGRSENGGQGLPQLPSSEPNTNHNAYHSSDINASQNAYNQQEMTLRRTTQQEEIGLLHKRLTEASIKEARTLSEKRILERRVAELRLAYDQQQQGLVDAASKALSYRQDVLEENIRLTYALQASDAERSVYITSLLPLLEEFDLQPTVTDAHSMVSAIKILVQHLRSELSLSEMQAKNKDSIFRPAWRADLQYHTDKYPHPVSHGGKLHGLEIVPQQLYTQPQAPVSPPSPVHQANAWARDAPTQFSAGTNEHGQFTESESSALAHSSPRGNFPQASFPPHEGQDDEDFERPPEYSGTDEPSINGTSTIGDAEKSEPTPRSPRMPTLREETTSEEGDPLPAIQGLQIVGHASLGSKLTACGVSINGTALCMFQWVRHYQNGKTEYIEGAAQPEYTITADDCNTMIAIECVPMDERNRRGELVTVFANESLWIVCDAMMQEQIDGYSASGSASFDVQKLVDGGPPEDNWEAVTLTLKRNSYELKRNSSTRRVVISEKYSADVSIKIPVGHLIQCVITSQEGRSFYIEFKDYRNRDVGVLTFRLFQNRALDGKRGRRKGGLPWFS